MDRCGGTEFLKNGQKQEAKVLADNDEGEEGCCYREHAPTVS